MNCELNTWWILVVMVVTGTDISDTLAIIYDNNKNYISSQNCDRFIGLPLLSSIHDRFIEFLL